MKNVSDDKKVQEVAHDKNVRNLDLLCYRCGKVGHNSYLFRKNLTNCPRKGNFRRYNNTFVANLEKGKEKIEETIFVCVATHKEKEDIVGITIDKENKENVGIVIDKET
jgi:hypothetical protein